MELKTLLYIHDLLSKMEEKAEITKRYAYDKWQEAKESEAKNEIELKKLYEIEREALDRVRDARRDFESCSWHN